MRSMPEDRTTRAVIRDEALRLFAVHGPDVVTVRQIATAAGVSPGLVVHHFRSKDGLRQEVDQYVIKVFEGMLSELTGENGPELLDESGAAARSLGEVFLRHLPVGSPLPGYLRRLLLSDTEAGRGLFRRLYAMSRETLDDLAESGAADRGHDPQVRAALLLVNDLSVFLLRDQLTGVLGVDPLSAAGLARWGPELLSIYAGGLNATPQAPQAEGGQA
ncbi:TetR/AcrR family transcriptional regulator [Streptomyces flavofungini]|uniref:TetR/AcrR family transcriptional regulator n=1 Tax=Streptomyces flavofungini TaxID=68200 RepID=UPI0025B00855|nr:TetR/AcrR family transcriptional regulator [Streptomyces flavofungini]WJV44994.1 TetR family transcriptional regulator [Streptomyces flavofungini]